jgi:2-haloacid dehalogenase
LPFCSTTQRAAAQEEVWKPMVSARFELSFFDVFGTTFDWWTGITEEIARISADAGVDVDAIRTTDRWREEFFIALASVRSGRREFAHLDILHRECLERVLDRDGNSEHFDDATKEALVRSWHRLPAWADVADGLERLKSRYTLAALSNGGFALTTNLVKNASLPFDCILSAQMSRHYKPDVEVYRTAVEMLDLAPQQLMMVAAHDWDIGGARAAGFRTAYVERPLEHGPHKQPMTGEGVACDLVVSGFDELADVLGC